MNLLPESKAKKLPGNLELISDREYTLSELRRRLAGKFPRDLTPGGEPLGIILELRPGQRAPKHLAGWYVSSEKNDKFFDSQ
jgi:hypothetical protein